MLLRLLCSLALAVSLLVSQVRKPDFSGTWKADPSKSTLKLTPVKNPDPAARDEPPPPPPPPDEQPPEVIDQKDNSLKIGELAFTLDGRENINELGQELLHKSKTHWEGTTLVTEWVLERDGQKVVTARQVRSLADGGKTQIVDTHVQTPDTISDSHAVMIKQP
jgi:hypothetical protein